MLLPDQPLTIVLGVRENSAVSSYYTFDAVCRFENEKGGPWSCEAYVGYTKNSTGHYPSLGRSDYPDLHTLCASVLKMVDSQPVARPR